MRKKWWLTFRALALRCYSDPEAGLTLETSAIDFSHGVRKTWSIFSWCRSVSCLPCWLPRCARKIPRTCGQKLQPPCLWWRKNGRTFIESHNGSRKAGKAARPLICPLLEHSTAPWSFTEVKWFFKIWTWERSTYDFEMNDNHFAKEYIDQEEIIRMKTILLHEQFYPQLATCCATMLQALKVAPVCSE